ncbi:MAG: Amino acid permease-associated region [Anaerolineales bacterium]|nr:Amino acid permease-associated region [Anaerolineales bacterium]
MATIRQTTGAPPRSLTSFFIGKPLPTHEMPHQTISKKVGLAVFASDALSSTAYATEAILEVLAFAGIVALGLSIPIAGAIVLLLVIVTVSYEQTIHAYPGGGGAYIVSRDNLGELPAQIAGAALLTDYILTVSVSISSGVAQITSAFPALHPLRVEIAVGLVMFMTIVNLRGVKESGVTFAVPTYFFLVVTVLTLAFAFYKYFTGSLGIVTGVTPAVAEAVQGLTLFLILRAFASGCTALTGVEAISNGIPAFQEPKSRNAGITLIWMSAILGVMFLGITFLSRQIGAQFSLTETVISQLGRTVWGNGLMWYILLGGTTLILIMAANTSYADFPRLGALIANDGFLPRQLTYRGSRLVFTYGIVALATLASLLIILFQAQVTALIPLYAIGVFLSFTLSQTGMAVRWLRSSRLKEGEEIVQQGGVVRYDPKWRLKLVINGLGAVVTVVVMVVFAVAKFAQGAWVIVLLVPTLVLLFFRIHHHYKDVARHLSLESFGAPPRVRRNRVLLLIGGVHSGALHALRYARSLSQDVTAVYVAADPVETEKIKDKWEQWGDGIRLVVIDSPYRRLIEPLLDYIDELAAGRQPQEMLTIVVPQFVPAHWWQRFLHMNTAQILQQALLRKSDIVVMEVPYHVGDEAH